MIRIIRPETDPYFNLAAEEYLFGAKVEDCFMLWRNTEAVICGKHQVAQAETDYAFLRKNGIPLIRRISGGGTVYHDPGNINFTFITQVKSGDLVDFKRYIVPVLEVLSGLGPGFTLDEHNNIRLNGLKISGNSEHVRRNKVLHHGTLLYATRLDRLNEIIGKKTRQYEGKWIRSRKTNVCNIMEHLNPDESVDSFMEKLSAALSEKLSVHKVTELESEEIQRIRVLAEDKYKSREWNWGYSPDYAFTFETSATTGPVRIKLEVSRGVIQKAEISPDTEHKADLAHALLGCRHHEADIHKAIRNSGCSPLFPDHSEETLAALFF